MKKLFYLLLIIPLTFSSCKKDDKKNSNDTAAGCMDPQATNYDPEAEEDDGNCLYSLYGVWETVSSTLNGEDQDLTNIEDLTIIKENDSIYGLGFENEAILGGHASVVVSFAAGDPNIMSYSGNIVSPDLIVTMATSEVEVYIDKMTNADNMTWRYQSISGLTFNSYIKTLQRSQALTLNDF